MTPVSLSPALRADPLSTPGDQSMSIMERHASRSSRRAEEREYRVVSAFAFVLFLAIAFVGLFMPAAWRARVLGLPAKRALLKDARAMAATSIPFAFMA